MSIQKFIVKSCAASTKVSGQNNSKIQTKGSVSKSLGELGTNTKVKQQTYYFQSDAKFAVGSELELDIDTFVIETKPFTIPTGPNAGETFNLNWIVGKK